MFSLRKLLVLSFVLLGLGSSVFAQTLEVVPEVKGTNVQDVKDDVTRVSLQGGQVWDTYNKTLSGAYGKRDLSEQLSSGIMDWTTILDYFARFVKYLSEIGIFVGACFIVYAGYVYATAVFQKSDQVSKGTAAIKNAIFGVIIITFSYAIMKAVMAAFL
ncbi:MAG: hypothetical protein WCO66_02760 [Candidatus Absconditabacteria bacterium]